MSRAIGWPGEALRISRACCAASSGSFASSRCAWASATSIAPTRSETLFNGASRAIPGRYELIRNGFGHFVKCTRCCAKDERVETRFEAVHAAWSDYKKTNNDSHG